MTQCTVCKGKKVIEAPGGEEIECPNCQGTGEAPTDPRD